MLVGLRSGMLAICFFAILIVAFLIGGNRALAEDWPTYQSDSSRSAATTEQLQLPLSQSWEWRSPAPPQMAWPGPARWDGYNKVFNMKDRMVFDRVFHPVSVGDAVLFGSSATDQVYCLDASSGERRWTFFCEAPVRFAPSVYAGQVYFGSDDGHVYCVRLTDGELVWRRRLAPAADRLPGNGRIISKWPVRTSVVRYDDKIYACCGMFPAEGVFLVGMNADDGAEVWRTRIPNLPAQGYLLASATRLYVPSGRNNPIVFDRANGELLRVVQGAGGTYCLLTGDALLFGPGKSGQLGLVEAGARDQLASFSGNHMIVTPAMSYLHSDDKISALDRSKYLSLSRDRQSIAKQRKILQVEIKKLTEAKEPVKAALLAKDLAALVAKAKLIDIQLSQCQPWQKKCQHPMSIVLAGDTLFTGGESSVAAHSTETGEELWNHEVDGRAYGLAVANGRLLVSTDVGVVHCFATRKGS